MLGNFHLLTSVVTFSKKYFTNTIRVSNSLGPDQDRHYVGQDLGSNGLQMVLADNKSPLARKELKVIIYFPS